MPLDCIVTPATGLVAVRGLAPCVYEPSAQRTISLWSAVNVSFPSATAPLRWPDKRAGAVLDYTLDASALLAADDVLMPSVEQMPSGLDLLSTWAQDGLFTLWLSGGTPGTDNPISLTLTTQSTRFLHRIVLLRVV